jgi:hypothetical protein
MNLPSLSRALSDARGSTHFAQHTPHAKQPRARTPGTYNGRETDAWALGGAPIRARHTRPTV